MLAAMRKKVKVLSKIALWPVIIAFIGTIFLVWGRGSTRPTGVNNVMKINGEEIPDEEYQTAYRDLTDYYRMVYGENFNTMLKASDLREQAVLRIINNQLKFTEARRLGLEVTPAEVQKQIMQIPAFKSKDGSFDADTYESILHNRGFTPSSFEERFRRDLIVSNFDDMLTSAALVTDAEVKDSYESQNVKVEISYVFIDANQDEFKNQVIFQETDLKKYWEDHQKEFEVPDQIKLNYLQIDPKDFESQATITDEEIEGYYQAQKEKEFHTQEQVKASHILIKVAQEAGEEVQAAAKAKIDQIAKELAGGAKFEDLATQYSQDEGSAKRGGEVGFFSRGQMVKPFEEKAFSMEVGTVSEPVKTQFGWHIIKVTEKKPESYKQLDEVKETIRKKLLDQKTKELALKKGYEFYDRFFEKRDFLKITEGTTYAIKETAFFDPEKGVPEIGFSTELKDYLKNAKEEVISSVLVTNKGVFLLSFKEELKAHVPDLGEIRDKVKDKYVRLEAKKFAFQKAEILRDKMRTSDQFDATVGEEKLMVEKSKPLTRSQKAVGKIGNAEELVRQAFSLRPGEVGKLAEVDQGYVILRVDSHSAVDEQDLNKQKDRITQELVRQKSQEIMDNWLQAKKKASNIELSDRYKDLETTIFSTQKKK